jgi:parallel beta-helix repeat protein
LVLIENGVHTIEIYQEYDSDCNYLNIKFPISIVGESREHCIVIGGLRIKRKKEDDVNVSNLTLRESILNGVYVYGASIHLDNVSVENSGYDGVYVSNSKRNTMKNCNVSHSKKNGLCVWGGGLMTISGKDTTIHHNNDYGLDAYDSSSSIHLVSPLTKEIISTNNYRGRNYKKRGRIQTVAKS